MRKFKFLVTVLKSSLEERLKEKIMETRAHAGARHVLNSNTFLHREALARTD